MRFQAGGLLRVVEALLLFWLAPELVLGARGFSLRLDGHR